MSKLRKIVVADVEWMWGVKKHRLSVYCPNTQEYSQLQLEELEDDGSGVTKYETITPKNVREFIEVGRHALPVKNLDGEVQEPT